MNKENREKFINYLQENNSEERIAKIETSLNKISSLENLLGKQLHKFSKKEIEKNKLVIRDLLGDISDRHLRSIMNNYLAFLNMGEELGISNRIFRDSDKFLINSGMVNRQTLLENMRNLSIDKKALVCAFYCGAFDKDKINSVISEDGYLIVEEFKKTIHIEFINIFEEYNRQSLKIKKSFIDSEKNFKRTIMGIVHTDMRLLNIQNSNLINSAILNELSYKKGLKNYNAFKESIKGYEEKYSSALMYKKYLKYVGLFV